MCRRVHAIEISVNHKMLYYVFYSILCPPNKDIGSIFLLIGSSNRIKI